MEWMWIIEERNWELWKLVGKENFHLVSWDRRPLPLLPPNPPEYESHPYYPCRFHHLHKKNFRIRPESSTLSEVQLSSCSFSLGNNKWTKTRPSCVEKKLWEFSFLIIPSSWMKMQFHLPLNIIRPIDSNFWLSTRVDLSEFISRQVCALCLKLWSFLISRTIYACTHATNKN